MYSPSLGRFISADTLVQDGSNPQALNRYSYVVNSPIKYVDASGHCFGFAGGADTTVCALAATMGPPGWIIDAGIIVVGLIVIGVGFYIAQDIAKSSTASEQPPAGKFIPPPGLPNGPEPGNDKQLGDLLKSAVATALAQASADGDLTNEVRGVTASLGQAPTYIKEALQHGLKYYEIPNDVYEKLGQLGNRKAQWVPNQAFIDTIIKLGESFRWASGSDPLNAPIGSWNSVEFNYLLAQGYKLWSDGVTFYSSIQKLSDNWFEVVVK